jgi:putative hydrolase of the HAD superfamily
LPGCHSFSFLVGSDRGRSGHAARVDRSNDAIDHAGCRVLIVGSAVMIRAVLWDFGGVILSSPFDAFNTYEQANALPVDFIRTVNATNPHANAWARLERSDIDAAQFHLAFADESEALAGTIRPEMVTALRRVVQSGFHTACLTNNVVSDGPQRPEVAEVMALFGHVVESSKVGCRKPEERFYEIACELVGVEPDECVFLDDLGVNLKPAAAMGMTTIKVVAPDQALDELESVLGIDLR